MTAKEMFEKLGYEYNPKMVNNAIFLLDYENDNKEHIIFSEINDTFIKGKFTIFGGFKGIEITIEELQAINKQIEELRWNNVSITNKKEMV